MLAKINFPRESLMVAGLLMVLCNFLVRLVLLVAVLAWFRITPGWGILFFPLAVAGLVLAGSSIGLLLAPLGSIFGDIGRAIPMITAVWMLLTPVVYPAKTVGWAAIISIWNPISPLIITAREALSGYPLSHLMAFSSVFVFSLVFLLLGWIGFRITIPHLIARMGG